MEKLSAVIFMCSPKRIVSLRRNFLLMTMDGKLYMSKLFLPTTEAFLFTEFPILSQAIFFGSNRFTG